MPAWAERKTGSYRLSIAAESGCQYQPEIHALRSGDP